MIGIPFWPVPSGEQKEAEEAATAYRKNLTKAEKAAAAAPDTICADCYPPHTRRLHEGRRLLCQMASCNCRGFEAKEEEPEAVFG